MLERVNEFVKKLSSYKSGGHFRASLEGGDRELIARIRERNLTYLSEAKLAKLAAAVHAIEAASLEGVIVEAGCALGGSSILLATLKDADRPLWIYDVFGMIPSPTAEDTEDVHARYRTIVEGKSKGIGNDRYYGYEENLYERVQSNLAEFGIDCERQAVSLIKGLVQDTMRISEPVALAHVDVDWYEPVKTCMERIFPRLVVGGRIILDDYHDWGGCRKAVDEYLRSVVGEFSLDDSAGSLTVTRTR